jgi:hypothetical protein
VDVQLVGGEAGDDLVEGQLQGSSIVRCGDGEAAAGTAGVGVGDRFAVGVVEVAVGLAAHRGRAATVGVVEDVVASRNVIVGAGWHGWAPPLGYFLNQNPELKRLRRGLVEVHA